MSEIPNLMCQKISTYGGGESARIMSGGIAAHPTDDPRILGIGGSDPVGAKGRAMGVGGGRTEVPLPPDASSTLYVEGLPANCTRREVSRILLQSTPHHSVKFQLLCSALLP